MTDAAIRLLDLEQGRPREKVGPSELESLGAGPAARRRGPAGPLNHIRVRVMISSINRLRTAGVVTVEVVVDETGKVISAVATSGPSLLREVAVQAALRARFSPTKLSGQPVKVSGLINYKFALSQ